MKIKQLFVAALAATALLASCSKEQGTEVTGKTQTIVVSLPGNIVAVRGAEISVPNAAAQPVANLSFFFLNGNTVVSYTGATDVLSVIVAGNTDIGGSGISADPYTYTIEQVAASVNRVIVVANISSTVATALSSCTTATQILTHANAIADQNVTGATVADILKTKTLIGECASFTDGGATTGGHADPEHVIKNAAVTLDAITARIEVGPIKKGTGFDELELVGVWVNNFYKDNSAKTAANTQLFPASDAVWDVTPATGVSTSDTWTMGSAIVPTIPSYTGYTSYYSPASNGTGNVEVDGGKAYAFHVFNGNVPHVILLVKGKYTTNYGTNTAALGNKAYFCGYITYTKFETSPGNAVSAFEANKIYKIGYNGSTNNWDGIEINPGDPITTDPEMTAYDLKLSVTVTDWTQVAVTPKP